MITRFLFIFPSYIKTDKMSFSPDFHQNRLDFVWISMKTCFPHNFQSFFPVISKKTKWLFLLISRRIDLILSESASDFVWITTISNDFSQFHKKGKKLFLPDIQQNWPAFIWNSMKKCFTHKFWWFFPASLNRQKIIFSQISAELNWFYLNQY